MSPYPEHNLSQASVDAAAHNDTATAAGVTTDSGMSPSVDVDSLRNAEEIKQAFKQLNLEEETVDRELDALLQRRSDLEATLRSLASSAPKLKSAQVQAQKLSSLVSHTAGLAEGVSVKVKQLDLAKSRVSECQRRVNDLIDLKLCSEGVKSALAEEDYEQAAAHLHRFLNMDEEGLLRLTAAAEDGNSASLEAAVVTLRGAETRVREIVGRRFDEAVKDEDLASIERFFKIFPLINMHDEGLKKFTLYLCSKIVEASKNNLKQAVETPSTEPRANIIFADTITLLFEGIARTMEIHQPLIETYYGPGRLLTVLAMLQEECDRQASRIVSEFRKKRSLRDKTARVKEAMSLAMTASSSSASLSSGERAIAAKDLDHVLSEMILIQARSEMYYKFVRKRLSADIEVSSADDDSVAKEKKLAEAELLTARSGLAHSMQDLLAEYILLEDYFMSQNVQKAVQHSQSRSSSEEAALAAAEGGEEALLRSPVLLDDVFFLLKKCVRRAVSGHNVDGVCAVVNNACTVLEQDFGGMLQAQVRMGFPTGYLDLTHAYNVLHSSYQQGKIQGGDAEKQKLSFLMALNNADQASDYIARLTSTLQGDIAALVVGRSQHDKEKLENCLAGLPAVNAKLKTILEQGMQQLRQSVVKPRVKPWMDAFVSHDVDDDAFADYEANDPFVQRLVLNLDGLLGGFRRSLTDNNYDALVSILADEVTAQLEKAVLKSKFSRLGGLLLDREVRSLTSFLTSVTTWSVRDKFSRIGQMSTVLNLETVEEMVDIWGSGSSTSSVTWRITPAEVRQLLGLRTDFRAEDVRRLRL